jgi:hypothetical protein
MGSTEFTQDDYEVGSVIEYGTGPRRVTVTLKEDDIKNGQPGFEGQIVGQSGIGSRVWGYDYQITRIVSGFTTDQAMDFAQERIVKGEGRQEVIDALVVVGGLNRDYAEGIYDATAAHPVTKAIVAQQVRS